MLSGYFFSGQCRIFSSLSVPSEPVPDMASSCSVSSRRLRISLGLSILKLSDFPRTSFCFCSIIDRAVLSAFTLWCFAEHPVRKTDTKRKPEKKGKVSSAKDDVEKDSPKMPEPEFEIIKNKEETIEVKKKASPKKKTLTEKPVESEPDFELLVMKFDKKSA